LRKLLNLILDSHLALANSFTGMKSSQSGARVGSTRDPEMRQCNTVEDLVHLAYNHLNTITPRGIAAFWSLLAKRVQNQRGGSSRAQLDEQLDAILCNTLENMKRYSHIDISTIAISLAKVMKQVEFRGQRAAAGSLHRLLHNLLVGINSERKQVIFDKVTKTSVLILSEFDARSLSNLIYSFGHAEYVPKVEDGRTIFDILALEAISKLNHFNSQDLSNIIWSYATVGESHPKLYIKIADHIVAMKDLRHFKPQDFSNIAWAFTTAGESHPKLFRKFGDHIVAMKDLRQFLPQHFSNVIWSYATAGESHPQLFSKFADHIVAMKDLGQFKPQELSNIIWAYATAGEAHPQLFSKFADHIVAMKDLGLFKPQHFTNIIWSYATVGINDQHLFTSFAPAVKSVLIQCSSQALANIAWAYAVANVNDHLLFNTDFVAALQANAGDFGLENLSQLHQWQLWQDELQSGINLPPALRNKCRQAFVSQSYRSSNLQDDVISVLSSIGLLPEEEVLTSSGYRLDALVEVNGMKVGIEVDGPSHFINQVPTGSTLLKRRQVSTLDDIRIVSVPYWEWDEFGTDRVKKQMYLRSKLDLNNIPIVSAPDCEWIEVRKGRAKKQQYLRPSFA